MNFKIILQVFLCYLILQSCSSNNSTTDTPSDPQNDVDLSSYFSVDFDALPNYENQDIPNYTHYK